jgi:hypothetical protein
MRLIIADTKQLFDDIGSAMAFCNTSSTRTTSFGDDSDNLRFM